MHAIARVRYGGLINKLLPAELKQISLQFPKLEIDLFDFDDNPCVTFTCWLPPEMISKAKTLVNTFTWYNATTGWHYRYNSCVDLIQEKGPISNGIYKKPGFDEFREAYNKFTGKNCSDHGIACMNSSGQYNKDFVIVKPYNGDNENLIFFEELIIRRTKVFLCDYWYVVHQDKDRFIELFRKLHE